MKFSALDSSVSLDKLFCTFSTIFIMPFRLLTAMSQSNDICQFLTRLLTSDWFLAMLKISVEHSAVPVGSYLGNRKQH